MAQKYLEERRGGTARQVHKGDKGTLTSSGRQCLGIVFVEVDSSILEYGERERESMHALARKDGGVSSTYWNLGEICGAYRTRHADLSLEKTWYLSYGVFGCALSRW